MAASAGRSRRVASDPVVLKYGGQVRLRTVATSMRYPGAFRALPVVRAALDAVPDTVNGLLIYRGRGGGAGAREPRRPKPAPSSAAVLLPGPADEPYLDLAAASTPAAPDIRPRQGRDSGRRVHARRPSRDGADTAPVLPVSPAGRGVRASRPTPQMRRLGPLTCGNAWPPGSLMSHRRAAARGVRLPSGS
jgi:hypothetical protein